MYCRLRQLTFILSYMTLPRARALARLRRLVATDIGRVIAKRMRQVRDSSGWRQHQLAAAVGIEAATLSRYESGKVATPVDILWKIATVFDLPLAKFLDFEGELPKNFAPPPRSKPIRTREEQELVEGWRRLSPRDRRVVVQLCRVMGRVREE